MSSYGDNHALFAVPKDLNGEPAVNTREGNGTCCNTKMQTLVECSGSLAVGECVHAIDKEQTDFRRTVTFHADKIIGSGSFGVVFFSRVLETGESVAIKKILQDKRFKNRELHILQMLNHPNIVKLKYCFFNSEKETANRYLNLVLEYVPETAHRLIREYRRKNQSIPIGLTKLYMYQLCCALAYIHGLGICHRDIKPHNLLIDRQNSRLKLCDFGSAKFIVKGEPSVSYICSRFYRAPELLLGSTEYSTAVDVWSSGCVLGEMLLGNTVFPGKSDVDQLLEIIKLLGTPSRDEIESMNRFIKFTFPTTEPHPWEEFFGDSTPPNGLELLRSMLVYNPKLRITCVSAQEHSFFDEARSQSEQSLIAAAANQSSILKQE